MSTRSINAEQRRAALVAQHRLTGDAADPWSVVESLVALHATDPATVHLAVLARSRRSSIDDVTARLQRGGDLVRWTAMRRTLFVLLLEDVPVVQAAIGDELAATLRRRLVALIGRNGIDPPVEGDLDRWLEGVEQHVERALATRGPSTGAELRNAVPDLRATIAPRTRSESPQGLTSPLLTMMGAAGLLVRGAPTGAWTSRAQRWEPASARWPLGIPRVDPQDARAVLARRWLLRYGPATVDDLQWWTGWSRSVALRAIATTGAEDVDLDGVPGINLPDRPDPVPAEPTATLLPALDPTPMGWRHRSWFTAVEPGPLYDAAGNVGPTIWWDGELIGGWASTATGLRTRILADRGREAAEHVEAATALLEQRLEGAVVTPAARTPLERRLSA